MTKARQRRLIMRLVLTVLAVGLLSSYVTAYGCLAWATGAGYLSPATERSIRSTIFSPLMEYQRHSSWLGADSLRKFHIRCYLRGAGRPMATD
jgi:hypothetical protein